MELVINDAWMQSYTGKQLFIFEPERSVICIEDIAHSLSYICRYGGHCTRFYSVAQHSLLVSELMLRHVSGLSIPFRDACDMVQAALLHDAAEYVLGDMLRPLKHFRRDEHVRPFGRKVGARNLQNVLYQCRLPEAPGTDQEVRLGVTCHGET